MAEKEKETLTEEETKTEETKTEETKEAKEEGKPDVQSQIDVLTDKLGGLETKNEELTSRNEVLQDSLDSALEEMALKAKDPEAEPEETKEEVKEETEKSLEEGKEPTKVEKEIEKSIQEDETYRTEQQKTIEGILTRESVRDLENEVSSALKEYPNADKDKILLEIEDGSEESVIDLAKVSHEKRIKELENLKTKNIDEFKEQLKKEEEGGISVPQSPGSSKAPEAPKAPGSAPAGPSADDQWGDALDKSKVEGGGA